MDSQRNLLIIALLFMSFIICQVWDQERNSYLQQQTNDSVSSISKNVREETFSAEIHGKKIAIKTDVLELIVNTYGGDIEQAMLLAYPKELKSNIPFKLLETTPEFIYQAQSGLIGRDGPDNPTKRTRPLYNTDQNIFLLSDNEKELIVPLTYKDLNGNSFVKTFKLKRGEYVINVDYNIKNNSDYPIELSIFGQLKQSVNLPKYRNDENRNFAINAFRGAAYSTHNKKYEKYKFDTIINNENLNLSSEGGWIAMLQRYFVAAWIPRNSGTNNLYTVNLNRDIIVIGYKSQGMLVQPGKTLQLRSTLWIGPEIQDKMANVAPYLDLTVDYGWLWFISQPLFKLLKFIHNFLNNWGISIIVITFIVRGIMYPLTKAQYVSVAKMRMLQPKIQSIKERLGDDKQNLSQEMMSLYKKEKVNPFGGCFPLLIQMPIFLALYYMLVGSVELRHAPFTLWIHDLSSRDPYYVLPILMGITMYLLQKMSPSTVTDPMQQKIVNCMPIVFTIFFLWFPSGLILYYIVSNLVTIIQQQIIYRSLEKHGFYRRRKKNHKLRQN